MKIIEGINNIMLIICISMITTTITGSIALIFGCRLQKKLEQKGYFELLRALYIIILMLFTVPIIPIISYVKNELLIPTKYMLVSQSGISLEVKSKPIIFTYTSIGGIFLTIAGIVFIIGIIRALKYSLGYIKQLNKYTSQKNICDKELQVIFDNCREKLNIKRGIPVYTSYRIITPMICGVIYPKVYLPERNYSDIELEAIFTHELVHYLHKDIFMKYWIFLISNIHWFNPLVKKLIVCMNDYSEKYCDIVAGPTLGMQEYLQQLLNIAQYTNEQIIVHNFSKTVASLANNDSNLLKRAENMERFIRIKKSKRYYGIMILLASIFIAFNCANIYAVDIIVTNGYKAFSERTIICENIDDDMNYQKWTQSIEERYYQDIIDGGVDNTIFALEKKKKYNMSTPIYFNIETILENEDLIQYQVKLFIAEGNIIEPILMVDPQVYFKIGVIEPNGNKRYIYNSTNMIKKTSFYTNRLGLYTIFLETNVNSSKDNADIAQNNYDAYMNLGSWILQQMD